MAQFRNTRAWRILRRVLGLAIFGYVWALGLLFLGQRFLLYSPPGAWQEITAEVPADTIFEVCLRTEDKLDLRSWYIPARQPGMPVLVVFHGNAGSIRGGLGSVWPYAEAGYGVLQLEYRGFSGNSGSPSEDGLTADARAAIGYLEALGIPDGRIVLFGESLGTGIAVRMATEYKVGAVVLRTPYASIAETAAWHYPIFPVRWLVWDKFDSLSRIGSVHAPLLIFHGDHDTVVPQEFGRKLFDAANEPKTWIPVPGAGHDNAQTEAVVAQVLDFLKAAVPPEPGTAPPKLPTTCPK